MKELLLWMVLAQAGDTGTTIIGLQRGCVEANPVWTRHPYIGLSVKVGGTTAAALLLPKLHRKKPKHAKIIMIVGAIAGSAATVWNLTRIPGC